MEAKLQFLDTFPPVPCTWDMMMLQGMTYKASVQVHTHTDPAQLLVQAWTSQCDTHSPQGEPHAVDLGYIRQDDRKSTVHHYGQTVVITSDKDFDFTFRLRIPGSADGEWVLSHDGDCKGHAEVSPARDEDKWTQGPDYAHILDSVHLGNFIAATHAQECGFSHVLNVADNLDMVYPGGGVVYHKVAMADGAHNPIAGPTLSEAVHWLQAHNKPGHRVLLNCRAGIGRAGSTAVAFVFAQNPGMTYEEAYQFCFSKRFVYPHVGLKDLLYEAFPRK